MPVESGVVIEPLLMTAPLIVLLTIEIPVKVTLLIVPPAAFVTLPLTFALLMLMQLIAEELVTGPLLPVTLIAHEAALAGAVASGPSSAAPAIAETSEVVASKP